MSAKFDNSTYQIRNVIIYLIVFCKNIFLPEESNGNILGDIISYNNHLDIFIISIYILESIENGDVKVSHNLHSNLQFVLLKFEMDIFDFFEVMLFLATYPFR